MGRDSARQRVRQCAAVQGCPLAARPRRRPYRRRRCSAASTRRCAAADRASGGARVHANPACCRKSVRRGGLPPVVSSRALLEPPTRIRWSARPGMRDPPGRGALERSVEPREHGSSRPRRLRRPGAPERLAPQTGHRTVCPSDDDLPRGVDGRLHGIHHSSVTGWGLAPANPRCREDSGAAEPSG